MELQPLPPEVEALALAELAKRVGKVKDATKAEFSQRYQDGQKETFRSPDGLRLGQVYRTDPDPVPMVTDREALIRHLTTIPGCTETVDEISGTDAQVLEVLAEHAPHLLVEITRVPEYVVANVLSACKAKGQATGPDGQPLAGVVMEKPGGVLTVKPDAAAGRAIEAMVRAGLLTWDGRRAITSGEQKEAS